VPVITSSSIITVAAKVLISLVYYLISTTWIVIPDIDRHVHGHEEAVSKVKKLVLNYERDDQTVDVELLKFLSDWLINHILKVDMKFIPYFYGKIQENAFIIRIELQNKS
jgi:hypothetical protein